MKRVVIHVRNGKAHVVSMQGKVHVEIYYPPKPTLRKRIRKTYRTCVYHIKRVLAYPRG